MKSLLIILMMMSVQTFAAGRPNVPWDVLESKVAERVTIQLQNREPGYRLVEGSVEVNASEDIIDLFRTDIFLVRENKARIKEVFFTIASISESEDVMTINCSLNEEYQGQVMIYDEERNRYKMMHQYEATIEECVSNGVSVDLFKYSFFYRDGFERRSGVSPITWQTRRMYDEPRWDNTWVLDASRYMEGDIDEVPYEANYPRSEYIQE